MSTRHQIENMITETELTVLQCLNNRVTESKEDDRTAEITEIAVHSGLRDKDEVLRALYSLEGRSLVSPFPLGDFTSNKWTITNVGTKALSILG